MKYPSEIEKMLHQENRDKKRIGSNIYKRTGKRGYTGAIRSPYDLLKGKAKKQYEGNSQVMTTNIYDKILPVKEFRALPLDTQKAMFTHWWKNYTTVEIKNAMNVGSQTIYNIKAQLGVTHEKGKGKARKPRTSKPKKVGAGVAIPKETIEVVDVSSMYPSIFKEEPKTLVNPWGLSINYSGTYKPDQIQKILQKLDLILQDETTDFDIEIKLSQKEN
jgi:hypothetical protein